MKSFKFLVNLESLTFLTEILAKNCDNRSIIAATLNTMKVDLCRVILCKESSSFREDINYIFDNIESIIKNIENHSIVLNCATNILLSLGYITEKSK